VFGGPLYCAHDGSDVYLSDVFICPESTKKTMWQLHVQRIGQRDHNATEHCSKYIKMTKNTIASDKMKSGQLGNEIKTDSNSKCVRALLMNVCG